MTSRRICASTLSGALAADIFLTVGLGMTLDAQSPGAKDVHSQIISFDSIGDSAVGQGVKDPDFRRARTADSDKGKKERPGGFGIGDIGVPFPRPSYGPAYNYTSYEPSANGAPVYDWPKPAVEPFSAGRARPVLREYDQSGRETASAGSVSPTLTQADPPSVVHSRFAKRDRSVIHEYDESGREIASTGSLSPKVTQADHPELAVDPLFAERGRSVIREYDESGREIASTGSLSPNVAQTDPTELAVQPLFAQRGRSVIHEYDESGRKIPAPDFQLYLIAFADHSIQTAISYRVDGNTLNYLTPDRQQKAVPLNMVDRVLSAQLNREREVSFELP